MPNLLLPNFSVRSSGGFPALASSRARRSDTRGAELVNHIRSEEDLWSCTSAKRRACCCEGSGNQSVRHHAISCDDLGSAIARRAVEIREGSGDRMGRNEENLLTDHRYAVHFPWTTSGRSARNYASVDENSLTTSVEFPHTNQVR